MALTTPLPEVPETRNYSNIGLISCSFLIIPGTSDYPTGGYVISALACRMKNIIGVSVDGGNAATNGYVPSPSVTYTLSSNNIPNIPTSWNFAVFWTGAAFSGLLAQIPNGTNLSGAIWVVTVQGY